jgi:ribose-phosphate pyrophosphokinase
MTPALFTPGASGGLAEKLAERLDCPLHVADVHRFPDGETRLRIEPGAAAATSLVLATLDRPDPKLMPLLFLARLLRDCGAERVLLIAPYLAYMRQDRRFNPGEGLSAAYFADLISSHFDGLLTVDAHLHRYTDLAEVYRIPAVNLHAAAAVAEWLGRQLEQPLLVGPDSESEQWVGDVARRAGAPLVVLEKTRRGDRDVQVSPPELEPWRDHTPVLVDDIISTGRSMIATLDKLRGADLRAPLCIGVHGIFAGDAEQELRRAGAGRIVTSNSIPHPTNAIDLTDTLVGGLRSWLHQPS